MSKVLQRGTAILAVIAGLVFATAALAQMPTSPWKKAAPFPEPDEELYGAAVNGKLYVIGGWGDGQGSGRHLRVRPGHRQMDEEKVDAAAGPPCGSGRCERQDLRERGLRRPAGHHDPRRRRMGTHRRRVGVRSGRRFLEDAGAAARQARGRGGRRGRRQDLRDRRRHDGGSVQGPVLHVLRTVSRSHHQRRVRPGHEQVGEPPADDRGAQPRVRRCRQRQDLRHWRPHRPRLHPVRHQHGCGGGIQSRGRPVECSERADADGPQRRRLGHGRPPDLRGGRRGDDPRDRRRVPSHRGVRAGDQFLDHAALHADAASRRRGRSDRQSLSPGERDDPVRRGDVVPGPETRSPHRDARRAGATVQSESSDGCEDRGDDVFCGVRRKLTRATTSTAPKAR